MKLSSIADIRRAMPKGTTVTLVNHRWPELSGERTVLTAQTARWELSFPESHPKHGQSRGSWLDIPKRDEVTFDGNSFTITRRKWHDDGPFCTITIQERKP